MKIDTGLAVVLAAVLIFYLRLIIIQRERVKRARREANAAAQGAKKKKAASSTPAANYSLLSKKRLDLVIAGVGVLAIIVGVLLNAAVIPSPALQPYWWLPTAFGIIAFSWAFKL